MQGVGRGVACLLPHLISQEGLEIELLTAREKPAIDIGVPEHNLPTPWPGVASAWLQWSAPRWLRDFDGVFHCPWYALPFWQSVPMVVTLHDLTFEHHPQWFTPSRRISYVAQARWAARSAGAIVTPSEFVAQDIASTYGVTRDRLFVAPNSADPIFAPDIDGAETLARLGVKPPYLVAVGGAPRRNLPIAIEAWRAVRKSAPLDLVVVGTSDVEPEPGLHVGRLNDTDWAAVLSNATALVYPTEYEGFGMPALESLACGTPVICCRVGALPEVLGDCAVWCERLAADAFTTAIGRILREPSLAADIRTRSLVAAARHPSWRDVAAVYGAAYRQAEALR